MKESGYVSQSNPTGDFSLTSIKMIFKPVHQSSPPVQSSDCRLPLDLQQSPLSNLVRHVDPLLVNSVQSGSQQHSGFAATEHEEVVQYTDFAFHLPVKSVMMIGVMRKYNLRDAGAQAPLRFFFFFHPSPDPTHFLL